MLASVLMRHESQILASDSTGGLNGYFQGSVVLNYKLSRKLGEGGFGVVYLAEHVELGRKAAVKILHPEYSRRKDLVDRFFREAKAVCAIDHKSIIDIQNFGRLDSGEPYYIMEYFPGQTLTEWVSQVGPLPLRDLFAIFDPVSQALCAAHKAGVIHRDLKPDNIMIAGKNGQVRDVKLLDFGIAKLVDPEAPGHSHTGFAMGTPTFMAPEQSRDAKNVDVRADVYSFGATIYYSLAGRPPFVAANITDLIVAVQTQNAPGVRTFAPSVPDALEGELAACLAKDRAMRPDSMRTAWQRIRDAARPPQRTADPAVATAMAPTTRPGELNVPGEPLAARDSCGQ
jgi:serine/threonine-protein kinase